MTEEKQEPQKRGWGFPGNSRRAHYFVCTTPNVPPRSLCYAWIFGGVLEDNNHDSADNCAMCKKLYKRNYAK